MPLVYRHAVNTKFPRRKQSVEIFIAGAAAIA